MLLEGDMSGVDWRVYRSSTGEPDAVWDPMANMSTVHFSYAVPGMGEQQISFLLKGSSKIMNLAIRSEYQYENFIEIHTLLYLYVQLLE